MNSETFPQRLPRRSVWARLRERAQYGLFTYELLRRIHRRTGFCVYPYSIYFATLAELSKREAVPEKELGLELRLLDTEDAELVAEIAAKRGQPLSQYLERARSRLQHEICMVALVDGEFAGYYWANTHACLDPITRTPLFPLASNEAYLAYLYVAPQYRGSRIAGALSIATRRVLADQGRNRFYYIISPLNISSRRHAARAGGRILERRLLLGVSRVCALDVRLGLSCGGLETPLIRASRAG